MIDSLNHQFLHMRESGTAWQNKLNFIIIFSCIIIEGEIMFLRINIQIEYPFFINTNTNKSIF